MLFPTDERLVPEDTDCEFDIYMRTAGATTLLSVGPTAGNGPGRVTGGVFSDDGTRVFFLTNEQLVAQDTDLVLDVYERSGTTTTLISAGGVNGNGAFDASLAKVDASGDHVFFYSSKQLAPQDTDGARDLYERHGGVTSLVSIGPVGGNNGQAVWLDAYWEYLASDDGTRVFFETTERLVSSDNDNSRDVYMARAGAGGYPRPKGATPVHVPLVPALAPCASPNRTHGPPLAFGSCAPPVQSSGHLTVGTPNPNGRSNSAGYLQLNVLVADDPPEDSDVLVDL